MLPSLLWLISTPSGVVRVGLKLNFPSNPTPRERHLLAALLKAALVESAVKNAAFHQIKEQKDDGDATGNESILPVSYSRPFLLGRRCAASVGAGVRIKLSGISGAGRRRSRVG